MRSFFHARLCAVMPQRAPYIPIRALYILKRDLYILNRALHLSFAAPLSTAMAAAVTQVGCMTHDLFIYDTTRLCVTWLVDM